MSGLLDATIDPDLKSKLKENIQRGTKFEVATKKNYSKMRTFEQNHFESEKNQPVEPCYRSPQNQSSERE